jgi:hypothetical protein
MKLMKQNLSTLRSLIKGQSKGHISAPGWNCYNVGELILLFLCSDTLARILKTLQSLTVNHAAPAGSRVVTFAINLVSERNVLF